MQTTVNLKQLDMCKFLKTKSSPYIGEAGDIKVYAKDFEAVPADMLIYIDFCATEINRYLGQVVNFENVEVEFVDMPYDPNLPNGLRVAGTQFEYRFLFWTYSCIQLSNKTSNNSDYWASGYDTAFLHELILHWLSKKLSLGPNKEHNDILLETMHAAIQNKWKKRGNSHG